LEFVKGLSDLTLYHCHPTPHSVHSPFKEEVSHILHLSGDPGNGLLYGYVELFNMIKMIIPFSLCCEGEFIARTYAWDLLHKKELTMQRDIAIVPTNQFLQRSPHEHH